MVETVVIPLVLISFFVYYIVKNSRGMNIVQGQDLTFTILEIQIPREETNEDDKFSSLSTEHLLASLHGLLRDDSSMQEHFSMEMTADVLGIKFYISAPASVIKFIESQVYAQYPSAHLRVVDDYVKDELLKDTSFEVYTGTLIKDSFFPLKSFRDFEIDPLANILSVLSDVKENEGIWIQFLTKPVSDGWQKQGYSYVSKVTTGVSVTSTPLTKDITKGVALGLLSIVKSIPTHLLSAPADVAVPQKPATAPKLTAFQETEVRAIENKLVHLGFIANVRTLIYAPNTERVNALFRSLTAAYKQFGSPNINELYFTQDDNKIASLSLYKNRTLGVSSAILLTNEELATIYHLPRSRAEAPNVSWVFSKVGEPPANLPTDDCVYVADTLFRGKKVRFGLKNGDDRLRHMYLIGKSGTGKSTLLETMITQDIANGEGVGVLDPHGETIDKILDRIPDNRLDDVVLFDPSDTENPVGLNLLEYDHPDQKNLMASAIVSAIKQHFDYSWGPRLEYLLNYAVLTLLEVPGTSLIGITRLLEDVNYQRYILHHVKDPIVLRFWEKEYKEFKNNQKLVTEAIAPIQNKVNRFLASSTIRNILGQRKSTIDIWNIMNTKKILLMNLSKGKIGEDNANLLGALLVSRIQFMALQRARIPYDQRQPFYLYVDEFQNFTSGSFESILSESRKYKLGLYLTHQYTAQLPDELLKAVFGNVGTIATFSLGAPDAKVLANEFAPYFDAEDIISLERFHIYIKLMIDGMTSLPFSAKILLPWMEDTSVVKKTDNKDKVIALSREKYGSNKQWVEDKIAKFVNTPFDKGMAIAEEMKLKKEMQND